MGNVRRSRRATAVQSAGRPRPDSRRGMAMKTRHASKTSTWWKPRHTGRNLMKTKAWLSAILVVQASLAMIVALAPSAEASSRCFGRRPTIVGTSRADVLEGTRNRDVISGLGGRDTIMGLG